MERREKAKAGIDLEVEGKMGKKQKMGKKKQKKEEKRNNIQQKKQKIKGKNNHGDEKKVDSEDLIQRQRLGKVERMNRTN